MKLLKNFMRQKKKENTQIKPNKMRNKNRSAKRNVYFCLSIDLVIHRNDFSESKQIKSKERNW